jgi:hypothetical protein
MIFRNYSVFYKKIRNFYVAIFPQLNELSIAFTYGDIGRKQQTEYIWKYDALIFGFVCYNVTSGLHTHTHTHNLKSHGYSYSPK